MIYAVGDAIYIHLATPVLKLAVQILEASDAWDRDGSLEHVEMRNFINELRAEVQHRETADLAAQKVAMPDIAFDPPSVASSADLNDDLR
jgi:hypothetical protein